VTRVRAIASVIALASVFGVLACGGDSHRGAASDRVIVRVGPSAIASSTLAHWISVLAPQHVTPVPPRYAACVSKRRTLAPQVSEAGSMEECRRQYQALKQQALSFLISSHWLIDEAADDGAGVSGREIEQRLDQERRSFPSGAEFERSLKAIAHTLADVKLEIQAELASENLYQMLREKAHKPTLAEIAVYYRQNVHRFHVPEARYFYIVEFLKSRDVARRIMAEIAQGKKSIANTSLHEGMQRTSASIQGVKRPLYEAIFAAKPHVLVGPVRINRTYFIVEVTQIRPVQQKSLAQVQGAIESKLSAQSQRKTLSAFVRAWRTLWTAKTDCRPGFVVQKCSQYKGPKVPEDPVALK
jgi:foldase protein PrsA